MKGYRFYREHNSPAEKRQKAGNGNVLALQLSPNGQPSSYWNGSRYLMEGVGAVFSYANSPVNYTGVDGTVLRRTYTRVSEAEARRIHPRLFTYLEAD